VSLRNDSRARGGEVPTSPPATRHRTGLWRDGRLVIGVALVAACALGGAALLDGDGSATGVWAARDALVRGDHVTAADLVRREVGFTDRADADVYVSAESPLPEGTVLTRDVAAGELLPRVALDSGTAASEVEVPLSVPAEAVPATVQRGAVVDVWVTADPALAGADAAEAESVLVFSDVTVLAVSRSGGALGPSATRQVIIGLDRGQERALPTALARLAQGSAVLVRKR
jgi:hypothetical protein